MNPTDLRHPRFLDDGLTFDDVLLAPRHSAVHPSDTDVRTRLTRDIELAIPLVAAAMDTVTEARMAITMAREGGIGIIHKNMSIELQAEQVDRVKRSESGMIQDPVTIRPDQSLADVHRLMERFAVSGIPVVEPSGRLVGIITNRDLQFETELERPVSDVMTCEKLITTPVGTSLDDAMKVLHRHRIEKLPVVDGEGNLRGLITVKDIRKRREFPNACKDQRGRLRVGAAIGVGPRDEDRARALVDAGVDVLVIDTAHGHSAGVLHAVARMRERLAGHADHRRQRGDARGGRGAGGARGGRREGGGGAGLHLHHARGHGRGRAAAHRDPRCGGGRGGARAGDRRRRHQVFRRRGEGARRRRPLGDDGVDAGRHGGEPRRGVPDGGPPLQDGARDGEPGRHERGLGRPLLPGGHRRSQVRSRGDRGPRAVQGPGVRHRLPDGGRPALRHGLPGVQFDIDDLRTEPQFVRITGGGLRESHPHDVTITREAPNYHA
jgi:IMP dehydrogenase